MKNNFIILLILISITLNFSSCNTLKYVSDDDFLLTKNSVFVNNKKNVDLIAEIVDVNNVKLKESFQEKNNKHGVFVTLKKNENFNFFVKF